MEVMHCDVVYYPGCPLALGGGAKSTGGYSASSLSIFRTKKCPDYRGEVPFKCITRPYLDCIVLPLGIIVPSFSITEFLSSRTSRE